jgi:rubrerythrin
MSNLFLANEILEINIAEEKNGAAFYTALAEKTENKEVEKWALSVAQQEKNHEKIFGELLKEAEPREPEESYPGEFDAYIEGLQGKKMFEDEQSAKSTAQKLDDKSALELALKAEYATLDFMKELVKHLDDAEKEKVELPMQEEELHIEQINEMLAKL